MATIYLHIGAPKTATSALQATLANSSAALLSQGVLYPSECRNGDAHHVLACDLIEQYQGNRWPDVWYGDIPRGVAWDRLTREIEVHGDRIHSVVISSELFFAQSRNVTKIMQEVSLRLAGHVVKVVVYLRRQDQLYSSFFNQDVKGIRHWSHSAYHFYQTHQMFRHDYHQRLQQWVAEFGLGNVLVRPYEQENPDSNDTVQEFCQLCGIHGLQAVQLERNQSLGVNQLYIKQCLNRIGFSKSLNDELLEIITTLCPEPPATDVVFVDEAVYRQYRQQWEKTNSLLSRDFCSGNSFFHQPIPGAEELKPYELDKFAIAYFLQRLVQRLRSGSLAEHRQLLARTAMLIVAEQQLWEGLDFVDSEARTSLIEWV